MYGLPFREVWALDFEFISEPGAQPVPVCMVAKELRSGRLIRMWQDDFTADPPFDTGPNSLFIAYMAAAEISCFLALGWDPPTRVLDLYVEFRAETNGVGAPGGNGLLSALSYHGLTCITAAEKTAGRALVMRGGPWSDSERRDILAYCQTDVDPLASLLERMLPHITARTNGLFYAELRGRYMTAVARMEWTGVPIDTDTLGRLRDGGWERIKRNLVAEVDAHYGVYEGTTFKVGRFAEYLHHHGIDWPLTETGRLKTDGDTFRDMTKLHPQLEPLKELRHSLGELRLVDLAVGPDGRNRAALMPFSSKTGRNQPGSSSFIFGPSVWLRSLIKPQPGRALAYIDWSAQEVAIAAALSGDKELLAAVESGDPYLAFAKRAGLAPADATKQSHERERTICKVAVLGSNYGMQPRSLAYQTGTSEIVAAEYLRRLAQTYPVFWEWADHVVDVGTLTGTLATVYGWPLRVTGDVRSTSLRNFPMQANGAEMLRLACCLATEAGVEVCAPVHDALFIEADDEDIDEAVANTRNAMEKASQHVLAGFSVRTDLESVVRFPDRYRDAGGRGAAMWSRVTRLLGL